MILPPSAENIAKAAAEILKGEVVIAPAGTVMGMLALPEKADKIRALKGRAEGKPFLLNVANAELAKKFFIITKQEKELLKDPSATVILNSINQGIRIPTDPVAAEILKLVKRPLISTSANISGQPPALTAEAAEKSFPDLLILAPQEPQSGTPSRIVKIAETGEIIILRA